MCDPKCIILGHSFVRRLKDDLLDGFDPRAKQGFDIKDVNIRLSGIGGRTVAKTLRFDLPTVLHYRPDIVIIELGTNDLAQNIAPEVIGSQLEELVQRLKQDLSVLVVGVCKIITRRDRNDLEESVYKLNKYIDIVINDIPNCFTWAHRKLLEPTGNVYLRDGVHLNKDGQYRLYRSYRGAVLNALCILDKID